MNPHLQIKRELNQIIREQYPVVKNNSTSDIGAYFERIAAIFYLDLGYTILRQNYRYRSKEIDLICFLTPNLIVFVEVKFRRDTKYGYSHEFVTLKKQHNIILAAKKFIHDYNISNHSFRFDIIDITINDGIQCIHDAFRI